MESSFWKGEINSLVLFFSLAFPLVVAHWMAYSDFFFPSPSPPARFLIVSILQRLHTLTCRIALLKK